MSAIPGKKSIQLLHYSELLMKITEINNAPVLSTLVLLVPEISQMNQKNITLQKLQKER